VLAVDDNPINLKLTKSLLESRDVEVIQATNGEAAVRLASEKAPDLILMDIQMPGMSGIEATRRIRALEGGNRHTPVIALTAHAYADERKRFLSEGIDDCIIKPLDDRQVWRLIDRWTHDRHAGETRSEVPALAAEPLIHDRVGALRATGGKVEAATELWHMLLGQLPENYSSLTEQLASQDFPALEIQAHRLAGSAASCCTPALKGASVALEKALRDQSYESLPVLVAAVQREISRLLEYGASNKEVFSARVAG
jgi:two-component system sensor histidine kinase BarA